MISCYVVLMAGLIVIGLALSTYLYSHCVLISKVIASSSNFLVNPPKSFYSTIVSLKLGCGSITLSLADVSITVYNGYIVYSYVWLFHD